MVIPKFPERTHPGISTSSATTREGVLDFLAELRKERDKYFIEYDLTPDDLWLIIPLSVHKRVLTMTERIPEGPDRTSKSAVLGMHIIEDRTEYAYIIPKRKLEGEHK